MPVPTGLPDIERRSLRELATDRIREAIFDGTLQPGEHLNDQELQGWLGMSRTPIREALNDLARSGLVEMEAQKYTRVALPDAAKRTEVLQTIGAMYGGVVRVTVPALTADQVDVLLDSLDRLLGVLTRREGVEASRAGWSFMTEIMVFCPNATLLGATKDILDGLAFQITANSADAETVRWDLLEDGFLRLKGAIETRNAVAAELAIEHIFRLSEIV